jgi:hypothetical protein
MSRLDLRLRRGFRVDCQTVSGPVSSEHDLGARLAQRDQRLVVHCVHPVIPA